MKLPSAFVGFLVLRRAFSLSAKPPALISKALSGTNTVSIQECVDAQGCDNVIFVDATWFHKGERNGAEE